MSNSTRFSQIVWLMIWVSWLLMLIGSQVIGLVDRATVSVPPLVWARAGRNHAGERLRPATAPAAVNRWRRLARKSIGIGVLARLRGLQNAFPNRSRLSAHLLGWRPRQPSNARASYSAAYSAASCIWHARCLVG